MKGAIGFVYVLPSYAPVPACHQAVTGVCRGSHCPCEAFQPPQGLPGRAITAEEVNDYWARLAYLDRTAHSRWPEAWA